MQDILDSFEKTRQSRISDSFKEESEKNEMARIILEDASPTQVPSYSGTKHEFKLQTNSRHQTEGAKYYSPVHC